MWYLWCMGWDTQSRWFGVAVMALGVSTKLLYVQPGYSTKMGDRLRAGIPPRYVTTHPGQLSLAILPWVSSTVSGRNSEFCVTVDPVIRTAGILHDLRLYPGLTGSNNLRWLKAPLPRNRPSCLCDIFFVRYYSLHQKHWDTATTNGNKKLIYRRGTARRATLVSSCCAEWLRRTGILTKS